MLQLLIIAIFSFIRLAFQGWLNPIRHPLYVGFIVVLWSHFAHWHNQNLIFKVWLAGFVLWLGWLVVATVLGAAIEAVTDIVNGIKRFWQFVRAVFARVAALGGRRA